MSADPFDTARTNFVALKNLVGRAVLVFPKELQKDIPSTLPGQSKTYDRIVADVMVLDGDPDPELDLEEFPATIEGMFISGGAVVPQLRAKVGKNRPVLGVVEARKAQTKGFGDAYSLNGEVITAKQKELALAAYEQYQKSQEDPFATAS